MAKDTIVFIHKGYSTCLFASILTARQSNPKSEIFLLGDEDNNHKKLLELANCKHFQIENYHSSATDFSRIYRHDGTNPVEYELFCIQRWFILRDFLRDQNRNSKILHLDSDAFLYDDIQKIFSILGTKIALCQKISPAFTYIGELSELDKFCKFAFDSFANSVAYRKLQEYVTNFNNSGMPHISDMTLFGEYASSEGREIIHDLRLITEGRNFYCDNFSYSQGMKIGFIGKRISRNENGKMYFHRIEDNDKILAGGVHFQGLMKTACLIYSDRKLARMLILEEIKTRNFKLSRYSKFIIYVILERIKKSALRMNKKPS